jgi:hypothetical protein
MSEKEDIIIELNKIADDFTQEYGELLCLRANVAAINKMLIDRNRGKELLDIFSKKIEESKKL